MAHRLLGAAIAVPLLLAVMGVGLFGLALRAAGRMHRV
jgi:hypothetical protein